MADNNNNNPKTFTDGDNKTTTTNINCSKTNKMGIAHLLARSNILELQPYRCARDDYSTGILLDANENSFGPPEPVVPTTTTTTTTSKTTTTARQQQPLERYPDPYQIPLKEQFIQFRGYNHYDTDGHSDTSSGGGRGGLGLRPSNVFVGVGSDEAIDVLIRIFCIPQHDAILIAPPTYGMYTVCAKINDVAVVKVPLSTQFDLDIPMMIDAITPTVKLLFICSPGNPTSKLIPLSDIRTIASHPKIVNQVIVVVDEAYIDFAIRPPGVPADDTTTTTTTTNSSNNVSAVQLITEFNNIVVLQTLSKAFGLAAIRCGFCIGPPDIIQLMNNVKAPYNVNALTSQLAIQALDHTITQESIHHHIVDILQQRARIVAALQTMDFVTFIYPSDTNFILFRVQSHAHDIYKYMADTEHVVTRYRGTEIHCTECIRVTVGTPTENDAFLQALQNAHTAICGGGGGKK